MVIRAAKMEDLPFITKIGEECYPPEEAVTEANYKERIQIYPDHFWILEENGEIASFINGPVIKKDRIQDCLFHHADLHDPAGEWQAILGVNTSPKYQKRGYASLLMKRLIADSKKQGRKGCILTCKDILIAYYENLALKMKAFLNPFMGARFGMIWFCVFMRIDYTHMCIYQSCRNIYSPFGIKNLNTLRVDILGCAIYTKRKGVSRE